MKTLKLLAAACTVAALAAPASAVTWNGTADYGVEAVGPFNTYDFSSAGVLLAKPLSDTTADSYYQSFVTQHLLDAGLVSAPLLNSGYEITVVANFSSTRTLNAQGETFVVNGGSFELWLDTSADRDFVADSGFSDGIKIMQGSVSGGAGSSVNFGGQQFGGGALQLSVTSYDTSVFKPNTIVAGDSIFTLRLNTQADAGFLNPITSVQGQSAVGGLKYAADGNLVLTAVPEPQTYAMLLAGLCMMGLVVSRRRG